MISVCTYAYLLPNIARANDHCQVTQFAIVNYTIIPNPISMEVDVGYEHDDRHVGGASMGNVFVIIMADIP